MLPYRPHTNLSLTLRQIDQNMEQASPSKAALHERKALEAQLEVHAQAMIDIKTRLNTMTPVARLPPELLSNVFTLLAAQNYEVRHANAMYSIDTNQTNSWIRVAHVCRYWRATALATPRLWSYIVVTTERAVGELLLRSKRAPLHVIASVPSHEDERQRAVREVMAEFSRIRALHLTGSSQALCDLFHKVSVPASMLESLKLLDRTPYYGFATTVPLVLPANQVPCLRKLEINGFLFSWDHPVFCPTLTTLLLCGRAGSDNRSAAGSFDTFLDALERMTDLQELRLDHVIPNAPDGTSSRKILLMRLSSLRIYAGDGECRSLLNHLALPPNVRFHITVVEGLLGHANIFLSLQNHLAPSAPMRTACIEDSFSGRMAIKGWRAELERIPLRYDPETSSEPTDLHFETMTEGDRISILLRPSTVFSGITILDIRVNGPSHRWSWKDVFAGMSNVRRLLVSQDQNREFPEALSHTEGDDQATLALPRLSVLEFESMHLLSLDYDRPPEFLDLMTDALIKRCNWGYPLQELHIKRCLNIYAEDVARVEEIVPEVTWDGMEEAEASEEEEEEEEEEEDLYYGHGWGYDEDDIDIDDYEVEADDLMLDGDLFFGFY